MLFFKPEKYEKEVKRISYNLIVSKREKEGKKGEKERTGKRERKENTHIRLENSNGRKNTKAKLRASQPHPFI